MMDSVAQSALFEIYRRENRSFLQYVSEAVPWGSENDRHLIDRVFLLAQSERQMMEQLAKFLDSHYLPLPNLGAYPTRFTAFNFAAIRKLFPRLIHDQREGLQALEKAQANRPGSPLPVMNRIIELKRRHLLELEKMQDG